MVENDEVVFASPTNFKIKMINISCKHKDYEDLSMKIVESTNARYLARVSS